jgi:hypothetical protein
VKVQSGFNDHKVACAFCSTTLLENDLPDYLDDLNATLRAAAKTHGGNHAPSPRCASPFAAGTATPPHLSGVTGAA